MAIYNPSLGATDETLADQLVFYTSRRGPAGAVTENEKLREIGLAQGIAEFARAFASTGSNGGGDCTCVDTLKCRIVTVQLEPGWWAHAQIAFTVIHNPAPPVAATAASTTTEEYSSRDVAPGQLLAAQLRRAHAQFCFLHGTLAATWQQRRLDRAGFCRRLDRYWLRWAWVRWEVVLSGSPVADLLGAGHSAVHMAGGRPGREGLAAPERAFLAEWARKERAAHGLADLVVSCFGAADDRDRDVHDRRDPHDDAAPSDASDAAPPDSAGPPAAGGGGGGGGGRWYWPPLLLRRRAPAGLLADSPRKSHGPPTVMPWDGCIFAGIGQVHVVPVAHYLAELYEKGDLYPASSRGGGGGDSGGGGGGSEVRRRRRKRRPLEPSRLSGASSAESSPGRGTCMARHGRDDVPAGGRRPVMPSDPIKNVQPTLHEESLDAAPDPPAPDPPAPDPPASNPPAADPPAAGPSAADPPAADPPAPDASEPGPSAPDALKPGVDHEPGPGGPEPGVASGLPSALDATARLRSLAAANGRILNMLTFGWSSRVQGPGTTAVPMPTPTPSEEAADSSTAGEEPAAEPAAAETTPPPPPLPPLPPPRVGAGTRGARFLVGFQGELDIEDLDDDYADAAGRITSRTVWLRPAGESTTATDGDPTADELREYKLVVYAVRPPYIFPP